MNGQTELWAERFEAEAKRMRETGPAAGVHPDIHTVCVEAAESQAADLRGQLALTADPWAFGPWCWMVGEVRTFPVPVACRGMQGLWPITISEHAFQVGCLDALVPEARSRWVGLTLLQPYASAIAIGPKRVENRPWRRTIPEGGLWVGLHAGKALYGGDIEAESLLDCWRMGPCSVSPDDPHWPGAPEVSALPRGVLLGAMRIDAIVRYPEAA